MHDVTSAMRAVERAIASGAQSPGWNSQVTSRLVGLRGAYISYLERSMGGTNAAVEDNPWLSSRLVMLRRDQAKVADEIDRLIEESTSGTDAGALRSHVVALLGRVARARQREVGLLYESVDLELGGEQ